MRRLDHQGMAVMVDALLFLMLLTIIGTFLIGANPPQEQEEGADLARRFHSVMLDADIPAEDGSAISRISISKFLLLASQDGHGLGEMESRLLELAVEGAFTELSGMNRQAWWVISLNGEDMVIGQSSDAEGVFADRRTLSPSVHCTLYLV